MKYEVFQVQKANMMFEVGVMHHDALTHADIAKALRPSIAETYSTTLERVVVVGAGFCSDGIPFQCWGSSDSLGISSRGDADEATLTSSMLNFQNVKVSPFDKISCVMGNVSQTCAHAIVEMRRKTFVVGHQFSAYNIESEDYADFEEGMLLRYKGPSLDAEGETVNLFAVDSSSKYYADYEGIYCLTNQNMMHIFEDSEIVRRLSRTQTGVALLDNKPSVVEIHGIVDPWPLTDDHEDFRARYSLLGDSQVLVKIGSLKEILEFFNIEMD